MKLKVIILAMCLCSTSFAQYAIRINLGDNIRFSNDPSQPTEPNTPSPDEWTSTTSLYGSYTEQRSAYNCSNWLPNPSSVTTTSTFQQTSSNCNVDQVRTVQAQEKNQAGIIRAVGEPTTEVNTLTGQSATRSYTVTLSDWTTSESTCGAWSPTPLSLPASSSGITEQTQTCNENQSRTRAESYVDNETSTIVSLPTKDETASTPTTKSRDVSDSFNCQADLSGDDWNVYMVYKDGSKEFALVEDNEYSNRISGGYQFQQGVEYQESPSDNSVDIFYKGNFVETRNYYADVVDIYQVCQRHFEWDE